MSQPQKLIKILLSIILGIVIVKFGFLYMSSKVGIPQSQVPRVSITIPSDLPSCPALYLSTISEKKKGGNGCNTVFDCRLISGSVCGTANMVVAKDDVERVGKLITSCGNTRGCIQDSASNLWVVCEDNTCKYQGGKNVVSGRSYFDADLIRIYIMASIGILALVVFWIVYRFRKNRSER